MNYYYIQSEKNLWTVGCTHNGWQPESDHDSEESAAKRVHYLNGGTDETLKQRIAELEAILDLIDRRAGPADKTCYEPGIKLSEAARRTLVENGHKLFKGEQVTW